MKDFFIFYILETDLCSNLNELRSLSNDTNNKRSVKKYQQLNPPLTNQTSAPFLPLCGSVTARLRLHLPLSNHIKLNKIKKHKTDHSSGGRLVVGFSWILTLLPFSSDVKLRLYKREKSELLSLPERWTVKIWRDKVKQHI